MHMRCNLILYEIHMKCISCRPAALLVCATHIYCATLTTPFTTQPPTTHNKSSLKVHIPYADYTRMAGARPQTKLQKGRPNQMEGGGNKYDITWEPQKQSASPPGPTRANLALLTIRGLYAGKPRWGGIHMKGNFMPRRVAPQVNLKCSEPKLFQLWTT